MKVKELDKIVYENLNARQKETYNFQKVSAILADYGFATIKLNDDWANADFIAQHIDGEVYLKVQLKGRMTFDKKYIGKSLYICFPYKNHWYLYSHDQLLEKVIQTGILFGTTSWDTKGLYHFPSISLKLQEILKEWRL